MTTRRKLKPGFLEEHSLSIVAVTLLLIWIGGYLYLDSNSPSRVSAGLRSTFT